MNSLLQQSRCLLNAPFARSFNRITSNYWTGNIGFTPLRKSTRKEKIALGTVVLLGLAAYPTWMELQVYFFRKQQAKEAEKNQKVPPTV